MCQPGAQFQALSHRGGKTPSLMFMARMARGICTIWNTLADTLPPDLQQLADSNPCLC
jgi:hypothetical protein